MSHKFPECFIWYFVFHSVDFFLIFFFTVWEEEEEKTFTLMIIPYENDVKILMLIKWKIEQRKQNKTKQKIMWRMWNKQNNKGNVKIDIETQNIQIKLHWMEYDT